MSNWLSFPENEPADATTVWVRIDRWSGSPFQAVYATASQEFSSVVNNIKYPAWIVSVWRPLP